VPRRRRTVLSFLVVGALVALAACSTGDADPSVTVTSAQVSTTVASPPVETLPDGSLRAPVGFTAVVLTVTGADGSTVEVCVWLADDPEERSLGLMDVGDPELGGKAGMVFAFDAEVDSAFWMRNTILPLSIAYLDGEGAVVSTADMEPCPVGVTDCPTYPPAGRYRMALEVPQGALPELGVVPDGRVALGGDCPAT